MDLGLWTILFALAAFSCSYKPPQSPEAKPGKGLNIFPVWYDNMLGAQYDELYTGELPLLKNAPVQRGVEALGMDLVHTYYGAEKPPFPFEFHVINLDVMNAFALPGGKVFVFRGLLQDLDDEAELAGVLSHEMGHVVARHGTKSMSKAILFQAALITTTAILSEKHEKLAVATYIGGTIGLSLRMLKYSRDYEREADWIAVHNVYKAGYDPEGMITLFKHFEQKEKTEKASRGLMFLSTHPSPQERQQNVSRELPKLNMNREWNHDQFGFAQVKAELQSMPPAPKEWKGKSVDSLTSLESMGQLVANARADELGEEQRRSGTQTIRIYIPSSEEWTNTAITLRQGQRLTFQVEGSPECHFGETCDLMGSLWKDTEKIQSFEIHNGQTIELEEAGTLQIGIKDSNYYDNSGWYVVTLRIS